MTAFLIKSTVAMGVLLGLYYILFEREKMHRFNRFYLISALIFSLALPFVIIPVYGETFSSSSQMSGTSQMLMSPQVPYSAAPGTVYKPTINYIPYIIWSIYSIVTLLLAVRFIKNIAHFFRKASANTSVTMENARLILLEEKVLPHTFLNYIFVNREEHEAKTIEDELYTHEYTHVKQKHTLDILFIEALKTLFWFNPLLYFYKKAIQLNHEFLADEKVIDTTTNTTYYQNLLLEKATIGTTFSMASNLTFSLTKKRFLMMTKTTSTTKAGFLKLAIAPVVTALMMLLCTETIAQQSGQPPVVAYHPENEKALKEAYGNTQFKFTDREGKTVEKSYTDLSPDEKKDLPVNPTIDTPLIEFGYATEKEMAAKRNTELRAAAAASQGDKVYIMGEVSFPPTHQGGSPYSFVQYIAKNFTLPKELKDKPNVIMSFSFVIEKDGSVSNVKITEDGGYGTAEQMTRILEADKWIPAKKEDETVRSLVAISLPFNAK
jgi:beta-lactamase regulating signal transducer with metallopeptidase domain